MSCGVTVLAQVPGLEGILRSVSPPSGTWQTVPEASSSNKKKGAEKQVSTLERGCRELCPGPLQGKIWGVFYFPWELSLMLILGCSL